MRQDDNNWLIDGGEAYDRGGGGILLVSPSQDAIQEFTITTSNYAADLGNSSGGMTSMAIKSGTKQFHGSAWEYNRNDALDAYNYLSKQVADPKKPELRYNAFGFNLGGPVEFKSSKPKTFFFYNQEWRSEINGGSIFNQVPTAAELAGNMSRCCGTHLCAQDDGPGRDRKVRRRRADIRASLSQQHDSGEPYRCQCCRLHQGRLFAAAQRFGWASITFPRPTPTPTTARKLPGSTTSSTRSSPLSAT